MKEGGPHMSRERTHLKRSLKGGKERKSELEENQERDQEQRKARNPGA